MFILIEYQCFPDLYNLIPVYCNDGFIRNACHILLQNSEMNTISAKMVTRDCSSAIVSNTVTVKYII